MVVMMNIPAIPKIPFIDKAITQLFYIGQLGFTLKADYDNYLIFENYGAELHLFHHPSIDPKSSHFMVYLRVEEHIENLYETYKSSQVQSTILQTKPWGVKEFTILDPNGTLLTFGQIVEM